MAWRAVGVGVGMLRQDASLTMNRVAGVAVLSPLLRIWIYIEGQAPLILHLALAFDVAGYSLNLSSPHLSWLRRREEWG